MAGHAYRTWRSPLGYRLYFPVFGAYFLVSSVVYFDGGSDIGFTALSLALGVAFTAGPFRPLVRLEADTVFVRSIVASRRFSLGDIVDVTGGYGGLTFITVDGGRFTAAGVGEKSNLARWLRRKTRSDELAATILAARPSPPA